MLLCSIMKLSMMRCVHTLPRMAFIAHTWSRTHTITYTWSRTLCYVTHTHTRARIHTHTHTHTHTHIHRKLVTSCWNGHISIHLRKVTFCCLNGQYQWEAEDLHLMLSHQSGIVCLKILVSEIPRSQLVPSKSCCIKSGAYTSQSCLNSFLVMWY